MKNILVFSFFPAFVPPKNGGELRLFHFYQSLSEYYNITILSSSHTGVAEDVIQHTPNFTERRIPKDQHFISAWPSLEKLSSGGDLSAVVLATSGSQFTLLHQAYLDAYPNVDIIIHDSPFTEAYDIFKGCDNKFRIYNAYNCETDLYQTLHPSAKSAPIHAIVQKAESNLLNHTNLVLYCNPNDDLRFREIAETANFVSHFTPNGMVPKYYANPTKAVSSERDVIFIGSGHPPNITAAKFIVEVLANKLPNVIFHIVGSCLSKGKYAKNVRVHGLVSNADKSTLLQNADLALNPMLEGSGSNLKVLDYFSYALPIVSTKFGMRGINAIAADHYIESTLDDFSNVIESSFTDVCTQKIGLNGALLANQHYTWHAIAKNAFDAIEQAHHTFTNNTSKSLVLVLNDYDSFAGVGGGCTRTQGLCEAIAESNKVAFLCFSSNNQYSVRQESTHLSLFAVPKTEAHLTEVLRMNAQFHVSSDDIVASQFCTQNVLINQIYACLRNQASQIMVEHCYMTPIPLQYGDQFIYSSQNVESILKASLLQYHPSNVALIAQVEAVERCAVENAAAIIVVSDEDAHMLIRGKKTASSPLVIRNGAEPPVDLTQHTQIINEIKPKISAKSAIFLGSAHMPNVLSAQFILTQVAPLCSDVQFHIVGSVCQTLHQTLPKNVVLWGEVSKEKKTAILQNCAIALNPMAAGGGSNIKLADYLMHGLFVLTTPFGVRGYPDSVLPHVQIAELDDFAQVISRIFSGPLADISNQSTRQVQFTNQLSMRGYAADLVTLLKSKIKAKKRVLFVTYRYNHPHLGGAEQMLAQLMQGLASCDEFTIDIVAPEVSHMSNVWRFAEQYQFEPTTSGLINLPNIRFARFPLSRPNENELFERLQAAWLAQISFKKFLNARLTHESTGLTFGWAYPESQTASSVRWANISCGIYFASKGNVKIIGYIDSPAYITVENSSGKVIIAAEVNAEFILNFDLNSNENIEITTSLKHQNRQDPRPLAFVAKEIRFNDQKINLSQQTLVNSALQSYNTKEIFELYHEASLKSRHLTNVKLTDSRGPFSDTLKTFIAEKVSEYDLVITHNPVFQPAIIAINEAKKHNIPSILIPHAHFDDDYYHFPDFLECAQKASLVLAAPKAACNFFAAHGCNTEYLAAGVNTEEQFNLDDVTAFEQVYPQNTPFVLVLGRKSSAKGYQKIINAVESLNQKGVNLKVVLIGPDDDSVTIKSTVATYLGLQARTVVRGALMQCKMLINMSTSESFGIVLLEAWLANKPVIANIDCAAFHDLAKNNENALLINELLLESSILELLNDTSLADKLATIGRQTALNYSWTEINNQFVDSCKKIISIN